MRNPFIRIAMVLAAVVLPPMATAQGEPARPNLSRGADPNDWEAYFEHGERLFERG